jgi:hypothetical protein
MLSCSVPAHADDDSPVALSLDYQLRRLAAPTPAERIAENRGAIYIYDSLDAEKVDAALDGHFDRIQNMMFIRTRHRATGGLAEVEDDGCE